MDYLGASLFFVSARENLTASSNVTTAKRIDPFAKKAKIHVGLHNHSNIKENEFATPKDFTTAMEGMSEFIAINLILATSGRRVSIRCFS